VTDATTHPHTPVIAPREALEFLNRAATVLAGSLDYEETLRRVTQLAVPELADWCAVYLSGDQGEREITSRHPDPGLEELLVAIRRRRRAGQGSESLRVQHTRDPILVTEVSGSPPADFLPEEREQYARLRARSYMIVPLVARGRALGAMTLLSTREGRHYLDEDLAFAQNLAHRFALAIDNAQLYDAAERSLSLLDSVFTTAPVGLAFLDNDQRYVRVNEALAAMNELPVEDHLGRSIEDVLGAAGAELAEVLHEVLRSGTALHDVEVEFESPGRPGDVRHFVASYTPVAGRDGTPVGVGITVIDITERRRLLEAEHTARLRADAAAKAEREARARADFLVRAGEILDASLDYEETLANVARIAVPDVADWCVLNVLDESGELRRVATAHADSQRRALGEEIIRRFGDDPSASGSTQAVARTGVTRVAREVTDELIAAQVSDPEHRELVRRLGLRSVIIAPLTARGRVFGTLTLASADSGRLFEAVDVQLAEELAHRAGVAIENARLYTERTHIAHTLQAKLLPERLPQIPGALLAARYRAAGELNEVGGDFYDVFARSEREWALVVGDVSGKGAEAAAATALARYTLRAGALEEPAPAGALLRLNTMMLADGSSQFATVVLAYAAADDAGGLRLTLSLGGHPQPLVLRADGRVEPAGTFGSLLGTIDAPRLGDAEVGLRPGDLVLLYTDGVTEAGDRLAPFGQLGLSALLAELAGESPQAVVDAVEAAVVDAQAGEPRDDIALLALAVTDAGLESAR
jgi:PAS domain S-box-containing protein